MCTCLGQTGVRSWWCRHGQVRTSILSTVDEAWAAPIDPALATLSRAEQLDKCVSREMQGAGASISTSISGVIATAGDCWDLGHCIMGNPGMPSSLPCGPNGECGPGCWCDKTSEPQPFCNID